MRSLTSPTLLTLAVVLGLASEHAQSLTTASRGQGISVFAGGTGIDTGFSGSLTSPLPQAPTSSCTVTP